jgi:putative ABC transport system permease protein
MRAALSRVLALFTRGRDGDLDEEIRAHIDLLAAENERRGMSSTEARYAARRAFGAVEPMKEVYRDRQRLRWMDVVRQDLRFALRSLRRSPGFALMATLTLALGIGVNTAIFSLVDAVLVRELPYADADRLVWASSVRPENEGPFNIADFIDYRDRNRSLASTAAYLETTAILTGVGDPVRLRGVRATANLFQTLGASPLLGRTLEPRDDRAEASPVVVITQDMWRDRLGRDPDVIGRKLLLNGSPYEVVGVLRSTFLFPRSTPDYAMPLAADQDPARTRRNSINLLRVIGRLNTGVSIPQAQADLTSIARQLRREYPLSNALKLGVHVVPLREAVLGAARDSLGIVVVAVSLLLMVVVVNVASSLVARGAARQKELAVRAALGASRGRLLAQPVAENVVLATAAGAIGVAIARWLFPILQAWNPTRFPRAELAAVDAAAVWYAAVVSIVVVLLIAIAPAWQLPRDIAFALRSRRSASQLSHRARSVLIVGEVALSFALLLGATWMSHTLVRLLRAAPGFDSDAVLTASVTLPLGRYNDAASIQTFFDRVSAGLQKEPGVRSYSVISVFPLSGSAARAPFIVSGSGVSPDRRPFTNYRFIEPNYFTTMRIPVRAGRDISDLDTATSRSVAVVSEQFVRRFLPGRDPLGVHLLVNDNDKGPRDVEIVGVVGNVKQSDLDEPPAVDLYVPLQQVPTELFGFITRGPTLVVRGDGGNPARLATSIEQVLHAAEADVAVTTDAASDVMMGSLAPRRFLTTIVNAFAAFCVVLAGFGLYSVMSYITTQRFQELAVRMAMGATSLRIARSVIGQAVGLALSGMAIGTALAIAARRVLATDLVVSGTLAVPFLLASALLLAIIAAAAWLPAARAARIDPAISLRQE